MSKNAGNQPVKPANNDKPDQPQPPAGPGGGENGKGLMISDYARLAYRTFSEALVRPVAVIEAQDPAHIAALEESVQAVVTAVRYDAQHEAARERLDAAVLENRRSSPPGLKLADGLRILLGHVTSYGPMVQHRPEHIGIVFKTERGEIGHWIAPQEVDSKTLTPEQRAEIRDWALRQLDEHFDVSVLAREEEG